MYQRLIKYFDSNWQSSMSQLIELKTKSIEIEWQRLKKQVLENLNQGTPECSFQFDSKKQYDKIKRQVFFLPKSQSIKYLTKYPQFKYVLSIWFAMNADYKGFKLNFKISDMTLKGIPIVLKDYPKIVEKFPIYVNKISSKWKLVFFKQQDSLQVHFQQHITASKNKNLIDRDWTQIKQKILQMFIANIQFQHQPTNQQLKRLALCQEIHDRNITYRKNQLINRRCTKNLGIEVIIPSNKQEQQKNDEFSKDQINKELELQQKFREQVKQKEGSIKSIDYSSYEILLAKLNGEQLQFSSNQKQSKKYPTDSICHSIEIKKPQQDESSQNTHQITKNQKTESTYKSQKEPILIQPTMSYIKRVFCQFRFVISIYNSGELRNMEITKNLPRDDQKKFLSLLDLNLIQKEAEFNEKRELIKKQCLHHEWTELDEFIEMSLKSDKNLKALDTDLRAMNFNITFNLKKRVWQFQSFANELLFLMTIRNKVFPYFPRYLLQKQDPNKNQKKEENSIRSLPTSEIVKKSIYMEQYVTTLSSILNLNKNPNPKIILSVERILKILIQMASTFKYLQSLKILHRDIKHSNIMLDDKMNVRIIDWGSCCVRYQQEVKGQQNKQMASNPLNFQQRLKKLYTTNRWSQTSGKFLKCHGQLYAKYFNSSRQQFDKNPYFDIYSFGILISDFIDYLSVCYHSEKSQVPWLIQRLNYLKTKMIQTNPFDRLQPLEILMYLNELVKILKTKQDVVLSVKKDKNGNIESFC